MCVCVCGCGCVGVQLPNLKTSVARLRCSIATREEGRRRGDSVHCKEGEKCVCVCVPCVCACVCVSVVQVQCSL